MDEKIFNRKMYKEIKKMDRKSMENYVRDVYRQGFKDGTEVGNDVDFRIKLSKVLNKTKGIGIKLYDKIMENAKEV